MAMFASLGRFARWLFLAIGLSVFAIGVLVVFDPGAAEHLPMEALIAALGSDYVVVAVLGLAAIVIALFAVLFRRLTGVREAKTPVVERVQSATYPGASFDRSNGRLFGTWASAATRDRLREAAIQSLMRSEGCSRSTAERRVDDGSWTDDAATARLLEDTGSRGLLGGEFGVRNRTERTIEAIESIGCSRRRETAVVSDGDRIAGDEGRPREGDATRTDGADHGETEKESGYSTAPAEGD